MSNILEYRAEYRCFDGRVIYCSHYSEICRTKINFAVYLPPQIKTKSVPILYYLSGLTCTEDNFTIKAGAQRYAAEFGMMLVVPDTSPRQTGIIGEDESWDLGSGASFYVDATEKPWQQHYQMYSYITQELPAVIAANFSVRLDRQGIFGHSMGGHGALIFALKNPDQYLSVSAFAPITSPSLCPWGQKAFSAYLGSNQAIWREYDATQLVKKYPTNKLILIDQGTADQFYTQKQLLPEIFSAACQEVGQPLNLRFQAGYDHSYFMISTFMADHIRHHATILST